MTLSGAATAFATASAILGTPAHAEMAAALSLCLDTKLTMVERSAAFEQSGWENSRDFDAAKEAFVAAAVLGNISATDTSTWNETRAWVETLDHVDAERIISGETFFLLSPDEVSAVFLQRNSIGLQTCLYVGNDLGLGPVADILDGSILRKIGSVQRIRGDGPKSLISSHFLDFAGRNLIDPPLRYHATFSVVLDQQPGDLK